MNLYAIDVIHAIDIGANVALFFTLGFILRNIRNYESSEISKVERIMLNVLIVSALLVIFIPRWDTLNILFR